MGGQSSCDNGGGACRGDRYGWNPKTIDGVGWCADYGQTCRATGGPATVYYGGALSWTKIQLQDGQSVHCSPGGTKRNSGQRCGCDPAPALKKWCFKKQMRNPNQDFCCGGPHTIIGQSFTVPDFRASSEAAVKAQIKPVVIEKLGDKRGLAEFMGWSVDRITNDIFDKKCSPCDSAHAEADNLLLDPGMEPYTGDFDGQLVVPLYTEPAFDVQAMLPLLVGLLIAVNCVVLMYLCIKNFTKKGKQYQVVNYQSDSEVEKRAFAQGRGAIDLEK